MDVVVCIYKPPVHWHQGLLISISGAMDVTNYIGFVLVEGFQPAFVHAEGVEG